MKRLLIVLALFVTSNGIARENFEIEWRNSPLKFVRIKDSVYLDLDQELNSQVLFNGNQFSKKDCRFFKRRVLSYIRGRDPESISMREYSMLRWRIIDSLSKSYGDEKIEAYEVTYLPFGFDLKNSALEDRVGGQINSGAQIISKGVSFFNHKDSILSLYSKSVRDELINKYESELKSHLWDDSLLRGLIKYRSEEFEVMCDLLHHGSNVSFDFSYKERDELVSQVKVNRKKMNLLYEELKKQEKSLNEATNNFYRGILFERIKEKVGFVYPKEILKGLGKDSDLSFFTSFFNENDMSFKVQSERELDELRDYHSLDNFELGQEHHFKNQFIVRPI